jgi:hypothetical protein
MSLSAAAKRLQEYVRDLGADAKEKKDDKKDLDAPSAAAAVVVVAADEKAKSLAEGLAQLYCAVRQPLKDGENFKSESARLQPLLAGVSDTDFFSMLHKCIPSDTAQHVRTAWSLSCGRPPEELAEFLRESSFAVETKHVRFGSLVRLVAAIDLAMRGKNHSMLNSLAGAAVCLSSAQKKPK